jgi:bifunctional ADP-heptose synthase (sugar kinase/adenylyltransferase)
MVDGGFDPLHDGHIAYFEAAATLGAPVLCSISPDAWVERKHAPLLAQDARARVIDAVRHVDYTYPAQEPTAEVLAALIPRYYVKGDDWRDRLPEAEVELCGRLGVEIVFLDTVRDSSSRILKHYREQESTRGAA